MKLPSDSRTDPTKDRMAGESSTSSTRVGIARQYTPGPDRPQTRPAGPFARVARAGSPAVRRVRSGPEGRGASQAQKGSGRAQAAGQRLGDAVDECRAALAAVARGQADGLGEDDATRGLGQIRHLGGGEAEDVAVDAVHAAEPPRARGRLEQ